MERDSRGRGRGLHGIPGDCQPGSAHIKLPRLAEKTFRPKIAASRHCPAADQREYYVFQPGISWESGIQSGSRSNPLVSSPRRGQISTCSGNATSATAQDAVIANSSCFCTELWPAITICSQQCTAKQLIAAWSVPIFLWLIIRYGWPIFVCRSWPEYFQRRYGCRNQTPD